MQKFFEFFGKPVIDTMHLAGGLIVLLFDTIKWVFIPPFRFRLLLKQMEFIGIQSLPIIILTGAFTGMVFAFQSYIGFEQFGGEYLVGTVVALGMARELGPVIGSIMVTARAGSAMTAEIGTMRVTEQIDALSSIAVDPKQYLILPRVLAGIIIMPMLIVVDVFCGIVGGYFVGVHILDINKTLYVENMYRYTDLGDLYNGLIKAVVFGLILTLVGCYKGFYTTGGSEGVGRATTESVVLSCVLILIFDYILTALMF